MVGRSVERGLFQPIRIVYVGAAVHEKRRNVYVRVCRSDPKRVYAGVAYDGLYRTDDGGLHWTKIFDGDVRSTSVDPTNEDVVYTGTEGVYLYRSDDRGATWTENTALRALPDEIRKKWWTPYPPNLGHVITIYIHPDDANMIYLCLEHGGILRSFDRGMPEEVNREGQRDTARRTVVVLAECVRRAAVQERHRAGRRGIRP